MGNTEDRIKQKAPWDPKELPHFRGDRAQAELSGWWLQVTVSAILMMMLEVQDTQQRCAHSDRKGAESKCGEGKGGRRLRARREEAEG